MESNIFFSWLKWKPKREIIEKRKQPQHAKMTSYIFFFQLPWEYISLTTLWDMLVSGMGGHFWDDKVLKNENYSGYSNV